jgi:hypothetical protein
MKQELEMLVGDKYALKDNSLIFLVGDFDCASLQTIMSNPSTHEQAVAEGKAIVERIMGNVTKEIGYQSIFGIGNLEAALRQVVSQEDRPENYNLLLYKLPDGVELGKDLATQTLVEEVGKEYMAFHERYLDCRNSYDDMSDHGRKIELQQKMRLLGEMVKEAKDTADIEYVITYLARKAGPEYVSIANDAIEIIDKTNQLSQLGVQVDPARFTLLDWNRELLKAISLHDQEKIDSLSPAIARHKQKISAMLEAKQKEKNESG